MVTAVTITLIVTGGLWSLQSFIHHNTKNKLARLDVTAVTVWMFGIFALISVVEPDNVILQKDDALYDGIIMSAVAFVLVTIEMKWTAIGVLFGTAFEMLMIHIRYRDEAWSTWNIILTINSSVVTSFTIMYTLACLPSPQKLAGKPPLSGL